MWKIPDRQRLGGGWGGVSHLAYYRSPGELVLLAKHLHVPQLAKVEVTLLLQALHRQLHLHHLDLVVQQ